MQVLTRGAASGQARNTPGRLARRCLQLQCPGSLWRAFAQQPLSLRGWTCDTVRCESLSPFQAALQVDCIKAVSPAGVKARAARLPRPRPALAQRYGYQRRPRYCATTRTGPASVSLVPSTLCGTALKRCCSFNQMQGKVIPDASLNKQCTGYLVYGTKPTYVPVSVFAGL